MTQAIAAAAKAAASPGIEIIATEPDFGPASIEGFVDGAFAVPGMLLRLVEAERNGAEAHIIACFDDTGLNAARSMVSGPVIGIGEAAFHLASMIGTRFSVVTTLSRSIPIIEANLAQYGLDRRCGGIRASEVPVLALEADPAAAHHAIGGEIAKALAEDGSDCIVLGCAGMAAMAGTFQDQFRVPVVEGVAAAVGLATAMAALGLKTSKRGAYAAPLPKIYSGFFAPFAPN